MKSKRSWLMVPVVLMLAYFVAAAVVFDFSQAAFPGDEDNTADGTPQRRMDVSVGNRTSSVRSGADRRAVPKVGDRTPSGNLIIHIFHQLKSNRPLLVELSSDYGIMVFNDGNEEHPKPRFLLAIRKSGSIQNFSTIQDFEAALAKLPRGAVIHKYIRCSIPTWFGLKFDWKQFESRCFKLGLTISDDPHGTCTCPD